MLESVDFATNRLRTPSAWYCAQVASGRERQLEGALSRFGIPTYFPVHSYEIKRNHYNWRTQRNEPRPLQRTSAMFPGYVFVALDDYGWARTRSIEVARKPRWLNFGAGPVQIPQELITLLQSQEQDGAVQLAPEYREGDELEVTDGIWHGRRGILASDPTRRIFTLHMIAESYALEPTTVVTRLRIDRGMVRLAH